MLTFFEYLRQRAFEAVLNGAHEALELLECRASFDKNPTSRTSASKSIGQEAPLDHDRANDGQRSDEDPSMAGARPQGEGGKPLPAPRLRGRPTKNASRDR